MNFTKIVKARGGELYAGGRRALIPAPGHSPHDRSASLLIGHTGRVIAYSFGSATPIEILADLRTDGLIDRHGNPAFVPGNALYDAPLSDSAKIRRALAIWSEAQPLAGSPSERYLRDTRGIGRNLSACGSLRHHPACPISVYSTYPVPTRPAFLALITGPGAEPTAIEITYLNGRAQRDLRLRLSRKIIGVVRPGSQVQIDPIQTGFLVGEGVATVLSASEILGRPCGALLGIHNMAVWTPSTHIERIAIAADRGTAGEGAATCLARNLTRLGMRPEIYVPAEPHSDFNDWLRSIQENERERGGRPEVVWSGE